MEGRNEGRKEVEKDREARKGKINLITDILKKKMNSITFDHLMFMGKIDIFPYQDCIMYNGQLRMVKLLENDLYLST